MTINQFSVSKHNDYLNEVAGLAGALPTSTIHTWQNTTIEEKHFAVLDDLDEATAAKIADNFKKILTTYGYTVSEPSIHSGKFILRLENEVIERCVHFGLTGLMLACQRGDAAAIERLLADGANVAARTRENENALHYLARCKNPTKELIALIPALIAQGASIEARSIFTCWTPLMLACRVGSWEVARGLILNGAHVLDGNLLHLISYSDGTMGSEFENVLKELVGRDVAINGVDDSGLTPLLIACKHGAPQLIKLLLIHGADASYMHESEGALNYLCRRSMASNTLLELLSELIQRGAPIDNENYNGQTPLMLLCANGHLEAARFLLARGAAATPRDGKRFYSGMLHSFCRSEPKKGMLDLIPELIAKGAFIDEFTEYDGTPLMTACKNGIVTTAQALLSLGANTKLKHPSGDTILHYICNNKQTPNSLLLVKKLLQYDKNINELTLCGYTALMFACSQGSIDIIKLLLENDADASTISPWGNNALHLLLGSSIHFTPAHFALVSLLISKGCEVNKQNKDGDTPLIKLLRTGQDSAFPLVQFLLEQGADPTIQDNHGSTPLGVLCFRYKETPELLALISAFVFRGAQLDPHEKGGHTPLMTACANGKAQVAAHLLTLGANVHAKEMVTGRTALYIASDTRRTSPTLMQMLIDHGARIEDIFLPALYHSVGRDEASNTWVLRDLCAREIDIRQIMNTVEDAPIYLRKILTSSTAEYTKEFICVLFKRFPSVVRRIRSNGLQDLLAYFIKHPEELMLDGLSAAFEFAFIFQDEQLAKAIHEHDPDNSIYNTLIRGHIAYCYPGAKNYTFAPTLRPIQKEHVKRGVAGERIPVKSATSSIDDLLAVFNTLEFSSKEQVKREKQLQDIKIFIIQWKEKSISGISAAHTAGYALLENALCGVIEHLRRSPQTTKTMDLKKEVINNFLHEIKLCGGKLTTIAKNLYYKVAFNREISFQDKVYAILADFRDSLMPHIIQQNGESVHAYGQVIRLDAETHEFGLPGALDMADVEDPFSLVGGQIDRAQIRRNFKKYYTTDAIVDRLVLELQENDEFKESYMSFWMQLEPIKFHNADNTLSMKCKQLKLEFMRLKNRGSTKAEMKEFIDTNEIPFSMSSTIDEALKKESVEVQEQVVALNKRLASMDEIKNYLMNKKIMLDFDALAEGGLDAALTTMQQEAYLRKNILSYREGDTIPTFTRPGIVEALIHLDIVVK